MKTVDLGLVALRVGVGLSLFVLFGIPKAADAIAYLHTGQWQFVDFNRHIGLPFPVFVAVVQTLNETLAAILVAAGWWTRYAAGALFIGFVAATSCSLVAKEPAWLLAAYLALTFGALVLTGPGKYSLDGLRSARASAEPRV